MAATPAAAHDGALDIPPPALAAYQRAAAVMEAAQPACHLRWELLAAVGRVESDHGRHGGSSLAESGLVQPAIIGVRLNGLGLVAAIRDTDAGQLDGDVRWDRAVGPMQFIPSTWFVVGVDADGDGQRNPQDIDDAALAAAVYLCAGGADLATLAGREAAVHRYNHDDAYVALVLRIFELYVASDIAAIAATPIAIVAVNAAMTVQTRTLHASSNSGTQHDAQPAPPASPSEPGIEPPSDPGTEPADEPPAVEEPPVEEPPAEEPPVEEPPTEEPPAEEPPTEEPPAEEPPAEEPPAEDPPGTCEPTDSTVPPEEDGEAGCDPAGEPEPSTEPTQEAAAAPEPQPSTEPTTAP